MYKESSSSWVSLIIVSLLLFNGCSFLRDTTDIIVRYNETSSGLKYRVLEKGDEIMPEEGDMLTIHYIAKVEDGNVFDNTYERNEPLTFRIGKGHVIEGWEEGLLLISKGGKAEFVIPPHMAYGEEGIDEVPPNSTVIFEIEMLDITKPEKKEDMFELDSDIFTGTEAGVKYVINQHGRGRQIDDGSLVKVHYKGYFEDGEIFDNSWNRDKPYEFVIGENMVIEGWEKGLKNLREGDEATLWIPHQLAYGETGRGPVPANTNLLFDIEILEVRRPLIPEPYDIEGKDTLTTITGMEYFIIEEGSGIKPKDGDIVEIHYTGYLADGEIFDTSVKRDRPLRFVAGSQQVIPGLDIAVKLMRKGSKMRFIIPPKYAYGDKWVGIIPPSSTLTFDIELLDIKK